LWKRHQGVGSDFKIPLWNWEIESKYSNGKVFPSWIDRDWITRFKNGTFRVTVHNRRMKLSTNSLERCFIHDIYLVEIGYLQYVLKAEIKARSRANKLVKLIVAKNSSRENRDNVLDSKNESFKNIETGNRRAITEEKTNGSTFKEISFSPKEISASDPEISSSEEGISTVSVKIKTFYNRLKISILNLLSGIEMLFPKLWKASRRVFYGCSQRMSV
jgi:hypothetical protein